MDFLAAAPTDADEVNINGRRVYVAKDTSGSWSSDNTPILEAALKLLSSNMDSRSVLPTKTPSFASSNVYPQISLKAQSPFGGGVNSNSVTSSLSGEGS